MSNFDEMMQDSGFRERYIQFLELEVLRLRESLELTKKALKEVLSNLEDDLIVDPGKILGWEHSQDIAQPDQ